MSYCRFSSDDWKCDIYVYESSYGFVVHIASSRYVDDIPPLLDWNKVSNEEWFASYGRQMDIVNNSERQSIGGSLDGKSFTYATLNDLYSGLMIISHEGYYVPNWVLSSIMEEITASNSNS